MAHGAVYIKKYHFKLWVACRQCVQRTVNDWSTSISQVFASAIRTARHNCYFGYRYQFVPREIIVSRIVANQSFAFHEMLQKVHCDCFYLGVVLLTGGAMVFCIWATVPEYAAQRVAITGPNVLWAIGTAAASTAGTRTCHRLPVEDRSGNITCWKYIDMWASTCMSKKNTICFSYCKITLFRMKALILQKEFFPQGLYSLNVNIMTSSNGNISA